MVNICSTINNSLKGEYKIDVLESPHLRDLRRTALTSVGGGDTDGSASAWLSLPQPIRDAADKVLASLVGASEELLAGSAAVLSEGEFHKNLLLDVGLDYLCSTTQGGLRSAVEKARLGSGTTDNVIDSGTITATASGSTAVVASAGFFTSEMAGQWIEWDSGSGAYISSVTNSTNAVLDRSVTKTGLFAVWAVNRTTLETQLKESPNAMGIIAFSSSGDTASFTWSTDFALETVNRNYTEGGVTCTGNYGGVLLSRFLFTGGTVTALIGQQVRLSYKLTIVVGATTPISGSWNITGWPVAGVDDTDGQYQMFRMYGVTGYGGPFSFGAMLWPTYQCQAFLSTQTNFPTYLADASAEPALVGTIGGYRTVTLSTYVPKTFYRDKTAVFEAAHSDTTAIRCIILGRYSDYNGSGQYWAYIFDHAQTKDGYSALTVTIRCGFTRPLTNP